MFTRFFHSLRAWVQSLWSRKARQSRSKQPSGPSPDSRTPARASADGQDHSSHRRSEQASTKNAGSAGVTNGDRSSQVFSPKPTTPISDGPEKPVSDPPEDTRSESDSTPAHPNGDLQVPQSNGDVDGSSLPNLEDPARESSEGIEPSEDITPGESLDSAEDKVEGRESSLSPPWSPAPPSGDDGEERGSKPGGPRNIPGRRNGPPRPPTQDEDDSKAKSPYRPKPELICRKTNTQQWEVVLSVVDECGIMEVRDHDGKPLVMTKGEYSLPSLTGSLYIKHEVREKDELQLFNGTPLIFKLRNNWSGDGRRVGGITNGHYIVIVPNHWCRTGHVPVEAEVCTDTEYKAHYFYVTKDPADGDVGGFEGYGLSLTDSCFELEGSRVYDDSDEGELFVGAIPKLKTVSGVGWARIGEEKATGWGKNFNPDEQTLAEILNGRTSGRFYIRVYDDDVKLLDSDEFRYLRDLREIRVNGEPYTKNTLLVPPYSERTELKFIGEAGGNMFPTTPKSTEYTEVCKDGTIILDPHPDADTVLCGISVDESNSVSLAVIVPRVWWRIEAVEGSIPDRWMDTPLVTTQAELYGYANSHAIIRVRLPRRVSSIRMGFGSNLDRTFRTGNSNGTRSSREIELQLHDFIYDVELDLNQPLHEDAFLNVQFESIVLTLIRIRVDRTPEIISFTSKQPEITIGSEVTLHWKTRNAEPGNVSLSPEIGKVQSSGNTRIPLYETMKFTLRLNVSGFKETTKSLTVRVNPEDPDDKLLTAREIRKRLKDVSLESIRADLRLTKRDIESFLKGKLRIGGYQSKDDTVHDIKLLYEDMSDYVCNRRKYEDDAKVRKEKRRAIAAKRKRDRLLGDDS